MQVQSIVHDKEGKAAGAVVKDLLTGKEWQIKAKGVVNATGCFGDAIRKMDDPSCDGLILGAAGVHVILPDHFSPDRYALLLLLPAAPPRNHSVCDLAVWV